jgi:uncharacterized protein
MVRGPFNREKLVMVKSTRRKWLQRCAGATLGVLGWTFLVEPRWLAISKHELFIPHLPDAWMGKTLVHVTDLHAGRVTTSYLQHAKTTIDTLRPDIVVFTGDFIDHTGGLEELRTVLKSLRPPPLGSIACLGNHDYGLGWRQTHVADEVASIVSQHGIRLLLNDTCEIDGLRFFGLDDFWGPRFGPKSLLAQANPIEASICLCHNPDVCDHDVWGSFHGAILSGHTHGGQCKPPFLPPPLLPVDNRRYTSGFFTIDEHRQLFISRGVGHTMRVRFNCRPEIVAFRLQRLTIPLS